MKKRLLITSIVMMLVVAVALSTATYAWFTSNTQVTASTVTMTAATNENDSIFIKWDGGSYEKDIVTTKSYSSLSPMIPNELVVNQTTIGEGAHQISFQTAGLTTVNGISTFKDVSSEVSGVYFATGAAPDSPANVNTLFIKNTSTANVVNNIKVTATFTPTLIECAAGELAVNGYTYYGSNDDTDVLAEQPTAGTAVPEGAYKATVELIRVAVFTRDLTTVGTNDTTSDYILRGVLANTASATYFGTIANGNSQQDFKNSANKVTGTVDFSSNTINAVAGATGFNICFDGGVAHTLKAEGEVEIKVLMWLDGEALNDNTQGAIAKVGLTFTAVNA